MTLRVSAVCRKTVQCGAVRRSAAQSPDPLPAHARAPRSRLMPTRQTRRGHWPSESIRCLLTIRLSLSRSLSLSFEFSNSRTLSALCHCCSHHRRVQPAEMRHHPCSAPRIRCCCCRCPSPSLAFSISPLHSCAPRTSPPSLLRAVFSLSSLCSHS